MVARRSASMSAPGRGCVKTRMFKVSQRDQVPKRPSYVRIASERAHLRRCVGTTDIGDDSQTMQTGASGNLSLLQG